MAGWKGAMDGVRWSLVIQVLIAISAIQMYVPGLNSLRPALLMMVVALGAVLMNPASVRWENLRAWPPRAVGWMFLLACGSVLFGLSLGGSARYMLEFYMKILVFFFLLVIGIRDTRDLALMVWSFVLSVGILVLLSLTIMDVQTTNSGLGRLGGNAGFDANDLGMIFLMGLPLTFLFMRHAGPTGRVLSRLILIGIPFSVALTGSRGAFVGLGAVGPALFFALGGVALWKRLGTIVILVAALIMGAPEGYWEQMQTIVEPDEDYNRTEEYGRVALAKRGFGYMLRFPVFGVGISNFPRAEGTISPIAVTRLAAGESVQWIAPHNTYAQVGAELGVGGLAIWMAFLWGGTIGLWRLRRRIPKTWDRGSPERRFLRDTCLYLPISFLAFAVTSFFLSHGYTPPLYIFISYMAGVHILVKRELARDKARILASGGRGRSPGRGPVRGRGGKAVFGGGLRAPPRSAAAVGSVSAPNAPRLDPSVTNRRP